MGPQTILVVCCLVQRGSFQGKGEETKSQLTIPFYGTIVGPWTILHAREMRLRLGHFGGHLRGLSHDSRLLIYVA